MLSTTVTKEVEVLRISYPIVLLLTFFAAFLVASIRQANEANQDVSEIKYGPAGKALPKRLRSAMNELRNAQQQLPRHDKLIFAGLTACVLGTLLGDSATNIVHMLTTKSESWWCGQAMVIYLVGSFFTHAIILVSVLDTTPSPTLAQFVPWLVAVAFELAILIASISIYTNPHREPVVGDPFGGPLRQNITVWESIEVTFSSVRLLILALLVVLYILRSARNRRNVRKLHIVNGNSEATRLLNPSILENEVDGYGAIEPASTDKAGKPDKAEEPWVRPLTTPSTSWWEYLSGYSLFFPYLWPSKSLRLRIIVVICFGLLILQRIVNVLVPFQVGVIIDQLSLEKGQLNVPWLQICLYILYRYLQGSQGLIENIRSTLWISVSQYSYMELSTGAFEHVHSLGLDFHLGKKIGEVLSALTKGSSINTFLEQVTFQMVPMLADLGVAFAYFLIAFDAYYALVVAIVTFWYLYVTVRIARWRAEMRRQMVNASRQEDAVKTDSLISYETVKYFNAEDYEFNRYRGAVANFQDSEYHSLVAQNLMNTAQNTVFMMGLMVTCFIAAYQITTGQRKVGKFMTLITYMAQLQTPLSFFGTFYRYMQSALINSERLLELFKVQASITDKPSAKPLENCQGAITFEDVCFTYDNRKPALNGMTFTCEPGTTTALVGESGGGKSTVFRLIFRFYQAETGRILIDGHDVHDVTINSLRKNIGVVPQDPVLFNESLMFNMKYANQDATDEDVYEACRAASIHDKIMSFPDGYQTKVGDRGMRLSGGEKQRVAIARTILKNPKIILLDEATAALDSETEQHIQEALAALAKGRTVLIIAHRLSTITTADNILVLHDGQVDESGTHEQLMAMDGRYTNMWRKQIRAQRKAVDQEMRSHAELTRRVSSNAAGSSSTVVEDSSSGTEESDNISNRSRDGKKRQMT